MRNSPRVLIGAAQKEAARFRVPCTSLCSLDWLLRALGITARAPDACDTTRYGSSRSSPRTFYAHHAAAVSAAIQAHESLTHP